MDLLLTSIPSADAGMLIRKPADEVYAPLSLFNNHQNLVHEMLRQARGMGKFIHWDWEMYCVSTMVDVKRLEPGKHILVEWKVDKNPTRVEWTYIARTPEITFIKITTSSFIGDGDKIVEQAMGTAERFGLVLAGLKATSNIG